MELSIIIPVYNCEKYIKECLNSIIAEMNSLTEIILLDDGSVDDSYAICCEYASERVKVYRNSNHGVAFTRNLGIRYASGKYLMFVDSDDILITGWSKIISKAIDDKEDIIYFSEFLAENNVSKKNILDNILRIPNEKNWGSLAGVYSKLFNREFLLANQIFFHESIINGEDALFNIHAIAAASSFALVPASIYLYRVNYSSATHSFNDKFLVSNQVFLKELEMSLSVWIELSNSDIKSYMDFCRINGIYLFLYRISLIRNSSLRKEKIKFFKDNDIENSLRNFRYSQKFGLITNIFCMLLKHKCFRFSVFLMRTLNKVRHIIKKNSIWESV